MNKRGNEEKKMNRWKIKKGNENERERVGRRNEKGPKK